MTEIVGMKTSENNTKLFSFQKISIKQVLNLAHGIFIISIVLPLSKKKCFSMKIEKIENMSLIGR